MNNKSKTQKGYIALILILIISGVTLLIAISTSLFGISESGMGLQKSQSSEVFYLATLCAEDALMKLKDDLNYSGNETLTFDEGSCDILSLEGSGNQDRTIKTTGAAYNQTRKIKIEIAQVNPIMEINTWQEVVSF